MVTELPKGWVMKFNNGHPIILNEDRIIVRNATPFEVYERLTPEAQAYFYTNATEEEKQIIDDLFNKSRN